MSKTKLLVIVCAVAAIGLLAFVTMRYWPAISGKGSIIASDPLEQDAIKRTTQLVKMIKARANDPASIDVAEATYYDNGAVLLVYRGRNAFNAVIVNYAVLTPEDKYKAGSSADISEAWHTYIGDRVGHSIVDAVRSAKADP